MKPHIKVIQRNGVDIFVTSSMTMKCTKAELVMYRGMQSVKGAMGGAGAAAINTAFKPFAIGLVTPIDTIKSPY